MCELQNIECHINILTSRQKLYEMDKIWKNICEHFDWKFIPTLNETIENTTF